MENFRSSFMKMLGNTDKYSLRFSNCRNGNFLFFNCYAPEKKKILAGGEA